MRAWTTAAELVRAKNLSGGLVARSAPGLPFLLSEGMEVAFVPPRHDAPRRALVESVQDEGRGAHLVFFEGVGDIGAAEPLVGCRCLVRRSDLPEDAFAPEGGSLVGFEVHDARHGLVGTVGGVIENPGQVLLSVDRPKAGPALVPLVDAFVAGLDEGARRIETTLPEGLLDL